MHSLALGVKRLRFRVAALQPLHDKCIFCLDFLQVHGVLFKPSQAKTTEADGRM